MKHVYTKAALIAALALSATATVAKVPESELARLDNELTPMGSIRAGNDAGTIPAWDGGLTDPPASYAGGAHLTDPFPDDQPLFTITAENCEEYAEHLSAGQLAMLRAFGFERRARRPLLRRSHRRLALPLREDMPAARRVSCVGTRRLVVATEQRACTHVGAVLDLGAQRRGELRRASVRRRTPAPAA